jgi:hypothetical protein
MKTNKAKHTTKTAAKKSAVKRVRTPKKEVEPVVEATNLVGGCAGNTNKYPLPPVDKNSRDYEYGFYDGREKANEETPFFKLQKAKSDLTMMAAELVRQRKATDDLSTLVGQKQVEVQAHQAIVRSLI